MNYKDGKTLKQYFCKNLNCNNKITFRTALYGSGLCKSCAFLGENNPKGMLGKENKWGKHTEKTKQRMSKIHSGKNNVNYIDGRYLKQYYCSECGKEISFNSGIYGGGLCHVCENIRRFNNGIYDNNFSRIEHIKLDGTKILLGSNWESQVAINLENNRIDYKINEKLLWIDEFGVEHIYIADFYLPKYDIYIEPHWFGLHDIYKNNGTKIKFLDKLIRVQQQNNVRIIILDSIDKCNWEYIYEHKL